MKKRLTKLSKTIQRAILFLFIACSPHLFASSTEQNAQFSISFKNVAIETAFKQIEKETNYLFFFNSDDVPKNKLLSLDKKNSTIVQIMDDIAAQANFTYTIKDRHLIVSFSGSSAASSTKKREISGRILDATGEPIIGASVVYDEGGVVNGTISDFDGNFSLKDVPEKGKVKVSYIGYQAQDLVLTDKNFYDIALREDTELLDEVVVTAMGIERKSKSLTYATQKIDSKELNQVKDASFINSLQGKVSGMTVLPNAGGAGGASKIMLRGSRSILGNNQPIVVLDGIPMINPVSGQKGVKDGGEIGYGFSTEGPDALSSINPDDIESINVLKGANAAALYGSAAANGVIMITTKKGKAGTVRVDFSSGTTFEKPLLLPQHQDIYGGNVSPAAKMLDSHSWGKKMSDMTDEELNYSEARLRGVGKADYRNFFETGLTQNTSVAVSGGNDRVKSYLSYGNSYSKGMIVNNDFMRNTFSLRQSVNFLDNKLNLDASLNYVSQNIKNRPGGGTNQNPIYHLYISPRNIDIDYYRENYEIEDGTWYAAPKTYWAQIPEGLPGAGYFERTTTKAGDDIYAEENEKVLLSGVKQNWAYYASDQNNPYWLTNKNLRLLNVNRVYGSIAPSYEPIKGLKLQGRLSLDGNVEKVEENIYATTQYPSSIIDYGVARGANRSRISMYVDAMLSFNRSFGDFSVSATLGAVTRKERSEQFSMNEEASMRFSEGSFVDTKPPMTVNIFTPFIGGLGGSRNYSKSSDWDQGVFFTSQIGYKDFVFADFSYREDRYRAFTQFRNKNVPDHYGYFGGGVNALIHEIVAFPEAISHLKVRSSYSEVGNSIPNLLFAAQKVNLITGALQPSAYADFENPIPEKTKSFEAGFDASFFRNKINLDFTYYNSNMHNNYLLTRVAGLEKPVNTGVIMNNGFELHIGYNQPILKDLFWKTSFNYSYNNNKIVETYRDVNGNEALISQLVGFGGKFQMKYKKGGSYGDLYATDFARNEDGSIVLSGDGAPRLSPDEYGLYVGNMNSKHSLGWSNTFTYKGLSLYFLIDGKLGGKVVSFTEAYLDRLGNSKRTGVARLAAEADKSLRFIDDEDEEHLALRMSDGNLAPIQRYYETIGGDINGTQYVYDATNFRLREFSIAYTFDNLFGTTKNLSISLVGRNLFFLYINAPVDPDTSLSTQNGFSGFDIFNMPTARSIGVNFSASF